MKCDECEEVKAEVISYRVERSIYQNTGTAKRSKVERSAYTTVELVCQDPDSKDLVTARLPGGWLETIWAEYCRVTKSTEDPLTREELEI